MRKPDLRKPDAVEIELHYGPALRASLDVFDLVIELLDILPEEHAEQAEELAARACTLGEILTAKLRERPR